MPRSALQSLDLFWASHLDPLEGAIVWLRGGALSCFRSSWTCFVFNFNSKRDVKNFNEPWEEEPLEALGRPAGRPPLHGGARGSPTTVWQPGRAPRPGPTRPPPPVQPDAKSGHGLRAPRARVPAGPGSSGASLAQGLVVQGCGHKSMAVFTYRNSQRFSKLAFTG